MRLKYLKNIPSYINSYKTISNVRNAYPSPKVLVLGSGCSLRLLEQYPLLTLKKKLNIQYIFGVNNVCLYDHIDLSLIDDYFICYPLYFVDKVTPSLRSRLMSGGDFTSSSIDSEISECFSARYRILENFNGRLWLPHQSELFCSNTLQSLLLPYYFSRRSGNTSNPLLPLYGPHSTTSCAIALARAYGACNIYTLGIDNNSFTTLDTCSSDYEAHSYSYYYEHAYDISPKKRMHKGTLSDFLFLAYKVNLTYERYKAIKLTDTLITDLCH